VACPPTLAPPVFALPPVACPPAFKPPVSVPPAERPPVCEFVPPVALPPVAGLAPPVALPPVAAGVPPVLVAFPPLPVAPPVAGAPPVAAPPLAFVPPCPGDAPGSPELPLQPRTTIASRVVPSRVRFMLVQWQRAPTTVIEILRLRGCFWFEQNSLAKPKRPPAVGWGDRTSVWARMRLTAAQSSRVGARHLSGKDSSVPTAPPCSEEEPACNQ
jgi:hypothetical protein